MCDLKCNNISNLQPTLLIKRQEPIRISGNPFHNSNLATIHLKKSNCSKEEMFYFSKKYLYAGTFAKIFNDDKNTI